MKPDGKWSTLPLLKVNSWSLRPARKTHWFIFLFITITDLVKGLNFLKATGCLSLFFLGYHQTVVLPNQSDNWYGRQQSQHTLPLDLYSWNGTTFPRSLFAQLWSCRKTCFHEPGNWHLMGKDVFSHCKSWRLAALSLPKNQTGSFFFFITTSLAKLLSFLKSTGSLTIFAGKSSDSTFTPNQGNTGMAINTHRALSPDIFFHGIVQCVLIVSIHNSETARTYSFVNLVVGASCQKKYFPPLKSGWLQH